MEVVKVCYSMGSLGKNVECEKAPDLLFDGGEHVEVIRNNVDETMINIEKIEGSLFLGGDHSITYGSYKGFSKRFKNAGIIIFDAHPDMEISAGSVSHEDYLRKLIEEGVIKKSNVILVGVRKISKNEKEFMNSIKVFTMEQIFGNEENVCDVVMELALGFDGLYLSIDIDVLDPAFAPGTGYLEPEGMSTAQLFYFLGRISKLNNLRRIDLVEINPDKDVNGITVKTGRRIIEFLLDKL